MISFGELAVDLVGPARRKRLRSGPRQTGSEHGAAARTHGAEATWVGPPRGLPVGTIRSDAQRCPASAEATSRESSRGCESPRTGADGERHAVSRCALVFGGSVALAS